MLWSMRPQRDDLMAEQQQKDTGRYRGKTVSRAREKVATYKPNGDLRGNQFHQHFDL